MTHEISAVKRESGKRNSLKAREAGLIPAVVYGSELKDNVLISLKFNEFKKLYSAAGESSIINLTVEGDKEPREVLVKDVSYEVIKGWPEHVDFYQVKKGQMLDIEVELEFIGEAPAVKAIGAILIKNLHKLSIRCQAKDLLSEIKVDLSVLRAFGDSIRVKDLNLPETIEVMAEPEEVVVLASKPEEEKIEAPVVAAAVEAAPAADATKADAGKAAPDAKAKTDKK